MTPKWIVRAVWRSPNISSSQGQATFMPWLRVSPVSTISGNRMEEHTEIGHALQRSIGPTMLELQSGVIKHIARYALDVGWSHDDVTLDMTIDKTDQKPDDHGGYKQPGKKRSGLSDRCPDHGTRETSPRREQ